MTTARRITRAVACAVLASLVLAGAVLAASPAPTVGGKIDAYVDKTIVVTNNGNVPANVVMSADVVTLTATTFDLDPGEKHTLAYTGEAVGTVSALFTIKPGPGVALGDAGTAMLTLSLKPYTPPFPVGQVAIIGLFLLGGLFLLARGALWARKHVRIVHEPEPVPAAQPERWRPRRTPTPAGMHADRVPDRHPHDPHDPQPRP